MDEKTIARFWGKVDKNGPTAPNMTTNCWLFTGATGERGYGFFWLNSAGSNVLAHRFAWQLQRGAIPSGLQVCHECDTRRCVRGDHFFIGTQLDNMRDKVAKDRQCKGSASPKTHLTEADVVEIRRLAASGVEYPDIALRFGCRRGSVSGIVHRIRWKHVP